MGFVLLSMLNPDFSIFNDNMFLQVRQILNDVPMQTTEELLDVTVGEPQMPPPDWLAELLNAESKNWQAYPKAFADQAFLDDVAVYIEARFPALSGRFDLADHIVPVPGTREPLNLWAGVCAGQNKTAVRWSAIRFIMPGGPEHWRPVARLSISTPLLKPDFCRLWTVWMKPPYPDVPFYIYAPRPIRMG